LSSVVGLVILALWARSLHRVPAKSLIRPYKISERARVGALWFLLAGSLLVGVMEWMPYANRRYDAQFFFAAVGLMSGFFVAWCCIAIGMWIKARRAAK
jgi:cell division protein FtsX